jgi:hypothetical protein
MNLQALHSGVLNTCMHQFDYHPSTRQASYLNTQDSPLPNTTQQQLCMQAIHQHSRGGNFDEPAKQTAA